MKSKTKFQLLPDLTEHDTVCDGALLNKLYRNTEQTFQKTLHSSYIVIALHLYHDKLMAKKKDQGVTLKPENSHHRRIPAYKRTNSVVE